jgi:heat shock protein HslJ
MQTTIKYVLALSALAFTGCATTNGSSGAAPNLSGTRWIVTRIDGSTPLRNSNLHADFGVDGRVNGDSGCNSFSGPYIQKGSTVDIGELLSTRRACADADRQRQETRVLAILQDATSARLDHGQLSLRAPAGSLLLAPGSVTEVADTAYRRAQYDCEGSALTVQYDTGRAKLEWRDGQDILNQREAASGIWYESSHNTLRGKQQDLVWTRDGHGTRTCRELR